MLGFFHILFQNKRIDQNLAKRVFFSIKLLVFIIFLVFSSGCITYEPVTETKNFAKGQKPANIILMIGDGMGLTQISAALYENKNKLTLEQFPFVGFHKPYAATDLITDSAAGATAFACGQKTYVSAIGVGPDTLPMTNIIEESEAHGLATGIIATSTIVHATPASFVAHQPYRVMFEDIAADFMEPEIDFIIGGGKRYFDRRDKDDRNLIKEWLAKDYVVADYFSSNLDRIQVDPNKNFVFFTADKHPLPANAGRTYLSYATSLGAEFLAQHSEKGFFLMVEGSQIDWAGHSNKGQLAVEEILDFDRAIAAALRFASQRDDTLVIVTADHETGGMAINPKSKMNNIKFAFTTKQHTGAMVPVFAYGPGAELFAGIYENTDIHKKMKALLGLPPNNASANR